MISISKAQHPPSFQNRGPGELGNGLLMLAKQIIIPSNSSETMMCHYLAQLYLSSAWFIAIVFFPLVSSPLIFLDLVIIYFFSRYNVMILISIFCVVSLNKKA